MQYCVTNIRITLLNASDIVQHLFIYSYKMVQYSVRPAVLLDRKRNTNVEHSVNCNTNSYLCSEHTAQEIVHGAVI
jgi:hypothetical protein